MRIPQPRDSLWDISTVAGILEIPVAAATVDRRPTDGGQPSAVVAPWLPTMPMPWHGCRGVLVGSQGAKGGWGALAGNSPPLKELN